MTWLLLAVGTAVLTSLRDAAVKTAMRTPEAPAVALTLAGTIALLLAAATLAGGIPPLEAGFIPALAVAASINLVAYLLLPRAMHLSDLSLVAPLLSVTPLFMLLTGPLILGELPGAPGLLGVAAIVGGAYLLRLDARDAGFLAPVRALLSDAGARLMLLVAFLYSISAVVDKIGVQASSPLAWGAAVNGTVAAALVPMVWLRRRRGGALPARAPLLLAGVAGAVAIAAQMTALTLTLAVYVIAVKRTSTLIGVVLGWWWFGEGGVRNRLLGAAVMLAGVMLLALA